MVLTGRVQLDVNRQSVRFSSFDIEWCAILVRPCYSFSAAIGLIIIVAVADEVWFRILFRSEHETI
jgi:hypothetical protein